MVIKMETKTLEIKTEIKMVTIIKVHKTET